MSKGLAIAKALGGASVMNQIGGLVRDMAGTSAKGIMGANANAVSRQAQGAQAAFNSDQANIANSLGSERIAEQYAFNSGQAASADDFTMSMWNKAAAWNEQQMQAAMKYNSEEAEKQRAWQEQMRATQYQTAVKDMEAAGLNPILAATSGLGGGIPSGSTGQVSAPQMSGASGAMASGGLLNGEKANISNYTGQLEYAGGMLGLMSTVFGGFSNAVGALANMPTNMLKEFIGWLDGTTTHESSSGTEHGGKNNDKSFLSGLSKGARDTYKFLTNAPKSAGGLKR